MDLDVAVVGAGIAGLAAADLLRRAGRGVHVFESADHVGGRMRTVHRDGWLVDTGAEMIGATGYPATWRLIAELGLGDADVPPVGAGLAMWREGRAHPDVGDLRGLWTGAGLSWPARAHLAALLARPRLRPHRYDVERPEATPLGARSVADLLRRLPRELHDYLFAPTVSGFYGWDTALACAGPLLAHLSAVGETRTVRTYRDGMDAAARLLAQRVEVSAGMAVESVAATGDGARLVVAGAEVTARQAVLAVPAPIAAALHPDAPAFVRSVPFRPMVKVGCLLDAPAAPPVDGTFGLFLPPVENPLLAGIVFDDRKHPGRVPPGRGLVTLVAGQAAAAELVAAPDRAADVLLGEARRYVPGLRPRDTVVSAFRHGLPMPTPAALAARAAFARRAPSTVEYAGDWCFLRPSSEAAVRSAEVVAERVLLRAPAPAVARG